MALFDSAQLAKIELAVSQVEQKTAGEIVVVSVPRSDEYQAVRFMYASATALVAAALLHLIWPELAVAWLLWAQVGVAVLTWLAFGRPALLRPLLPAGYAHSCVARRARLEFLEHRVFETRDRTGVLMLLSELERQVFMLGDSGIYSQLQEQGFQAYVDRVVAAIRGGRAADGVCEVIGDLGTVLAAKFPIRPDDTNELSNAVRQEKR
jgi:putative membrane protein